MDKSTRLEIGKITSPHGLRGEVKLTPWTDDIGIFETIEKLYGEDGMELCVISAKPHKNSIIIMFEGIDHINKAEQLRDKILLVDRADLPKLKEGEHYIVDVLGMTVVTADGIIIGELYDWLDNGAHTIYIVKRDGKQDALIPALPQFIKAVDYDSGIMMVELIEGLVDL